MISNDPFSYVFIRVTIFCLRAIAPLSAIYCCLRLAYPKSSHAPLPVEIIAIAETTFYLLFYLPRRHVLQRAATQPTLASPKERRKLFYKCWETVSDLDRFVSLWFKGAPVDALKRDDVKDWLCWGFLDKPTGSIEDDEELEEYVSETERILGRRFEEGRGSFPAIRTTIDKVEMQHRSLLYYIVSVRVGCMAMYTAWREVHERMTDISQFAVGGADTLCYLYMLYYSFHFHRLSLSRSFSSFPFRPLAPFARHQSPTRHLSYWHRPHTSQRRLPILFIHGIGIGLHTYLGLFQEFSRLAKLDDADDQVGMIALEIMPISFRLTHTALHKDQMCAEILMIMKKHQWTKIVLVAHSYGTIIANHLIQDPQTGARMGPMLLVDPVTFSLHAPDVAYNFTCRQPTKASEHQLYYFASMDMGVAHTLTRRFSWTENILWKEELKGRRVTVVLSGKDIIIDTETMGRYLTREDGVKTIDDRRDDAWKKDNWTGEGLEVLWFDDLNHAQVFDTKKDCRVLLDVMLQYCKVGDLADYT
jgi:pimeloyl-ACP methyl ester carboxylesterase